MRGMRQWVGDTVGGLPRAFWYLWANTLLSRVGSFIIIVLAIYLTQDRGFSETFAGLVIGLWGAGGAVGTLLGGVLADRWGRKATLLTALYSSAAVMVALGLARTGLQIALAVVALGLVGEAARPALSALMIDIVPERDRLRAFSLNYWVTNVGFAVAATTAGLVAGVDYLLLFTINAATTAAAATLVVILVREPARVRAVTAEPSRPPSPGLRAVFADRVFLGFVGVNVLTSLVFMQHISTLPMAMGQDGLSPSTFGTVIALNGILIVAGQLFVPRLLRNRSRAATLATAAVIMGLGFGLNALADTVWFYGLAVLVWTLGEMLNSPSNSATNAELSPADLRGRYQGVFSLSWSAASFAAPILGAVVLQYLGNTALWLGCLGLSGVVAVMHLHAGPARERRAAELRQRALVLAA
ncbi:MAG: MDR family MFS transporter [Micromonosporaceae bacterium]